MEGYFQYRRIRRWVDTHDRSKKGGETDLETPANSDREEKELGASNKKYVEFEYGDPNDPRCWPIRWKLFYTIIVWLLVFVTGWSSSATSTAHGVTSRQWGVSEVAESLATSMFLWGVAFGAIFSGPTSETVGRLPTYLFTFAIFLVWTMASALAPNFAGQIIFRGLAGLFAAPSMSIYGGSLADMWATQNRAFIWPFFALSTLLGPNAAPIVSGWLTQQLGWRWDDWFTLMISAAVYLLAVLCLPETYAPIILSYKAQALRKATGDDSYKSEHDESGTLLERLQTNLKRIARFTFTEATTVLFGVYLTFLYLLIYGFLEGFDFIFTLTYSFDVGDRYTAFAAVSIGILLACPYVVLTNQYVTHRHKKRDADDGPVPEARLVPANFASPLLAGSMFWLAFTTRINISYWSDLGACCLFGFATFALFTPTYHYILDTYSTLASSALCAITFMRYLFAGGMVIATQPLYNALTTKWMLFMLGCIASLLMPIPWVFWKFGAKIREKNA